MHLKDLVLLRMPNLFISHNFKIPTSLQEHSLKVVDQLERLSSRAKLSI